MGPFGPPATAAARPVLGADTWELDRAVQELELEGLLELENCRRNPLYYLERYVWTIDEHEQEEPARPLLHGEPVIDRTTLMPVRELDGREDDYLRYIALVWWREPLIAVPKSRQLRLSHLMVNLHGWLAQFYSGQRVLMQSKKFEDADALLERRWQSMQKERDLFPHMDWPEARRKEGRIIYGHNSIIMAAAQGADVVRSYTFSAIFSDETGFQPQAEEAYTAAVPTIEGGGKYTMCSSANPGFFQRVCYDQTARDG